MRLRSRPTPLTSSWWRRRWPTTSKRSSTKSTGARGPPLRASKRFLHFFSSRLPCSRALPSPPLFCRLAQPDMARRRRLELRLTCGPRDQELYLLLHWAEGHLDLQEWLERAKRRRALALSRCGALYCVSCVVWIFVQKTYARMPCHASHSHTVHVKT